MSNNKPIIVANWKCNPLDFREAKKLFFAVARKTKGNKGAEVVICPPFVFIPFFMERKGVLRLGAQNCFWREKGAFTGEISPFMLKGLGVEYVILGHSERRNYFREDNKTINKKVRLALSSGLKVILCIGEKLTIRRKGKRAVENFLKNQLKAGLEGIKGKELKNVFLAYEPIWAIGSGRACPWEEAEKIKIFLKKVKKLPFLYGGSVNSENARDFIKRAKVQGLLIGGASLKPKEFAKIIKESVL